VFSWDVQRQKIAYIFGQIVIVGSNRGYDGVKWRSWVRSKILVGLHEDITKLTEILKKEPFPLPIKINWKSG